MVSTCPVISKSFSILNNPLVAVPRAPITISNNRHFHVPQFFNYLFAFFQLYSVVRWDSKVHNSASSLFFFVLIIIRSGCLAEIGWSVCISKSQRSLCASFSWTYSGLCIYHLFVWPKLNFLYNSQWITLPVHSCLILYSFWINLQHSLHMGLIISSLLPHNLHPLFCCVLSILALIWVVLMALFSAAIRRDSVSLLRFPFLVWDVTCSSLKTSIELFFFPFLFSGYFCYCSSCCQYCFW